MSISCSTTYNPEGYDIDKLLLEIKKKYPSSSLTVSTIKVTHYNKSNYFYIKKNRFIPVSNNAWILFFVPVVIFIQVFYLIPRDVKKNKKKLYQIASIIGISLIAGVIFSFFFNESSKLFLSELNEIDLERFKY